MPYTYQDKYLDAYCDATMEARATTEVVRNALPRVLSAEWLERVVVIQAYIFACLDNQANPEDLFTAKLKEYRTELTAQTARAYAAADAAAEVESSVYSFPVVRA